VSGTGFKGLLESKKRTPHIVVHTFRVSKSRPSTVHIFAESSDDIAYYGPYIRSHGYEYVPYDCDNKAGVIEVAESVRQLSTRLSECLFFVDADLDRFLGREINTNVANRLFVTKYYSIESYLCEEMLLDIIFLEMAGITKSPTYESCRAAIGSNSAILRALLLISGITLLARRRNLKVNLNNFSMARILRTGAGGVKVRAEYFRQFLSDVSIEALTFGFRDVRGVIRELGHDDYRCFVRGKYLLEYFLWSIRALKEALVKRGVSRGFSGKRVQRPKFDNARELLVIMSARMPAPADLEAFLLQCLPEPN
jgi:hypothetical protein